MKRTTLRISFNSPLSEYDTKDQTYGCRANNPEICGLNMAENICAFVRQDHICKKQSRAWRRKFAELRRKHNE